jgi:TolB-like protein
MDGANRPFAGVPVVAVLPFTSLGAEPPGDLIAQGLHEDICGALTRFRSLRVISPRSAAAVAELDDTEIGRRLAATHVLRGRLAQDDARLRLSASLVACAGARQLWDERFEMPLEGIFALQDELVARIAATLNARLEEAALAEARRQPADMAVHGLVLQGLNMLRQGTLEADEAARVLFEQALARDPLCARAHAGVALSWFNEWSCQFWDRFEEASRQAYVNAHRALDLDDSDGMVHLVVAKAQIFRRAYEQGSWYLDRALALCPNDAELLVQAAVCEVYLGRPEAGVEHVARAMRLNPYHPNVYYSIAAYVHFFARDIDTALALQAKSDAIPFVDAPAYCAVALAHAGELVAARRELDRYHAEFRAKIIFGGPVEPGEPLRWLLEVNPYRRREDVDYLLEGFRLLGEAGPFDEEPVEVPTAARLVRTGDGWLVEFAGRRAILPDLKGLHDVRRLLERPGEEFHCLDLAERAETTYGADAALDEKARAALKARIRELQEDLAEAEDMNDTGRAERARSEMDRLVEALSRALGLGGRGRRLGDLTERARTTVTWRIRYALRKIEAAHTPLGRHLAGALRTGTFCVYCPEVPIAWRFAEPSSLAAHGS